MGCIKKYYAANGEESILFNQLADQYGESVAEEIYLKLNAEDFQELFQEETEIAADLTPSTELSKTLNNISDRTPFLRDIEMVGNMNQYARYLQYMFPNTSVPAVVWSEPSDRTEKPNSLKSAILRSADSKQAYRPYFVYSPTIPSNLRDAMPFYMHLGPIYITNSFYQDQKSFEEKNPNSSFVKELSKNYDAIVREDGAGGVSSIAILDTENISLSEGIIQLGSKEDVAMFREWVRNNPLEGPVVKVKNQKFDFRGSVYDMNGEPRIDIVTNPAILNKLSTIRLQKRSAAEIADNLIASSQGKIGEAAGKFYPVLGKNVQRVSTVLDRPEYAPYVGVEAGQPYEEKGTRYHAIAEDLILGKSIDEIKSIHNILPQEIGYINAMNQFIKKRKAMGGQLLAELKLVSTDADNGNGIAGTIDIVHILPTGRAIVFDLKTANNTPRVQRSGDEIWDLKHDDMYKARRYTYQTMIYAALLEKGDASTGRLPVPVDAIYVIPIEVTYGDSLDDLVSVNMKNPQDIKTNDAWKKKPKGKTFYDLYKNKVNNLIYNPTITEKQSKIKSEIEGRSITDFLKSALGVNSTSPAASARNRAINYVERVPSDAKTFKINNVSHTWTSNNREDRIAQVEQIFIKQSENSSVIATQELIRFFKGGYKSPDTESPSYSYDQNSKSRIVQARANRVVNILKSAGVDGATRVEALPGHDGVVLIHRSDGTYDLLTLTDIPMNTEIKVSSANANSRVYQALGGRDEFNSIFGNHITGFDSNNKRVTLANTHGDYERLRLGLIGMELSSRNPDIRINRILVDELNSTKQEFPRAATMKELAHNIKVMHSIESIKNQEPAELKQILDDESVYDESRYGDDPITDLLDYLTTNMDETKESKTLAEEIEKFQKKQITSDELAKQLLEGSTGLLRMIRNSQTGTPKEQMDAISSDPMFQTLARAYISLKGYGFFPDADITSRFAGDYLKWFSSPTMTGNRMADTFFDVFRSHINRIKQKMDDFVREKEPVLQSLILNDPIYKRGFESPISVTTKNFAGTDAILGLGRTIFDDLLVTKTDAKGNRYRVPMLKAKGSPEYNALSKSQQNFIDYFNKTMKKYNPDWMENAIPILSVSSETKLSRSKQALARGEFRQSAKDAGESVATFWRMASNRGNFETGESVPQAFQDVPYDAFAGQMINDDVNKGFSTESLKRIGLDGNMSLVDSDLNESFETDLEKVMSIFALNHVRKEEMTKALPKYHLFRSILKYTEIAYGADSSGSSSREDVIKMMDDFVQDLAFNIKQGEDKVISKFFNVSMQLSSIALIGFSPKVTLSNATQNMVAGGLEAFLNTVTKDPRYPGLTDYTKAWGIMSAALANPALARKIHYVRRMYLPDDVGRFTSDKHMLSARGLINQQSAYALDSMIDLGFREQYLIAQMLKDGVWDAHTLVSETSKEDGYTRYKIIYDPKKDPRFQGQDGQALYRALKKSMVESGEIEENQEIKGAYDNKLRERLKAYIARNIGTADRDVASPWARYALLHALSQFRTWFRDRFLRSTIKEYDADIFGEYKKSKNGEYVWSPEPLKGMLRTFADFVLMPRQVIASIRKGELSREDQKNLWLSATSLVSFGTLYLMMLGLVDDDDDEKFSVLKVALTAAQEDVINSFTLSPFTSLATSPLVFASYYQKLFKTTMRVMHYGMEGDWEKSMSNFKSIVPVINQLPDDND